MPVIPFSEFVPDSADIGNPGSIDIRNAIPGLNSYKPIGELVTVTDATVARPRGAIEERDSAGNTFQYSGDETALYTLAAGSWTDATRTVGGAYATGTDEMWEFVRWKEKVLATNWDDEIQTIGFSGANFADLVAEPRCRHLAVVRDFVVAGNTWDSTDGNVHDRVRWSAQNDETDWTISPITGADARDLNKGGAIQRIVGGDFGVIVSERSTWRMTFVGAPTWFEIAEVLPGVGALAPGAVVNLGDTVFIWSEHGMVALRGGSSPVWIGEGKLDQFLREDLDESFRGRMSSVADPQSGIIYWAYPGAGNTNGRPNRIIAYNTIVNRWAPLDKDVELIWRSGGVATTLDGLDDVNLGADLVSNGDFASDTIWTKGTGWTIAAGVGSHAAGTASDIEQTVAIAEDTFYRVQFDVANRTAGSITPVVGSTSGTAISANGTDNKETIRAGATSVLAFSATSDFDGDIDNASIKQINDLDSMAVSLDSAQWKGGSPVLAAFDESFKNGNFTGSPMTATFTTKELEINAGSRTALNAFTPVIDGGTVTARVGSRNRQSDSVTYGSSLTQSASGRFTTRENAKFHRFELTASGEWNDAIGIRIEQQDARPAGRRG